MTNLSENLDNLIIDGKEIYPNLPSLTNNPSDNYISSKYIKSFDLNINGDYGLKNDIILEGLVMNALTKLNSPHFPIFQGLYKKENKIYLFFEEFKKQYKGELTEDIKNVIVFQIIFSLYISKVYEFNHNNLTINNIYIEEDIPREIEYIIEGIKYKMFNHGINIKLFNFNKSRITMFKTYIFNENDRIEDNYDVKYDETNDLNILNNLLTNEQLNKIKNINRITIYSLLSSIYNLQINYLDNNIPTINEDKSIADNDIFIKYIAFYPKNKSSYIEEQHNLDSLFLYLLSNNYNRLLYKFLSVFNVKLDYSKVNFGKYSYSKNRKIIFKMKNKFQKKNTHITNKKGQMKIYNYIITENIINTGDIFDPILLSYHAHDEWLMEEGNIIINVNGKLYGTNKLYYKEIDDNNLFSEMIIENDIPQYRKSLNSRKFVNLNKYGIDAIINIRIFDKILTSDKREFELIKNETIFLINYEYLLHNPKISLNEIYTFIEEEHNALKNYTYQWDVAMNTYLRSNMTDKEYINTASFLDYYERFGEFPEESLKNIKDNIEYIDNAFMHTHITEEEIVTYRGTKDCTLYDELNLSFISTSKNLDVAKTFAEGGCIYEMHISPGIPYIYLEDFTLVKGEYEILLPRNLIVKLREQVGNKYIVDVLLSSLDQFKIDNNFKLYNVSNVIGIEENNIKKYSKNDYINDIPIDPITGDEIDNNNSIIFNDMCYNINTLYNRLIKCIENGTLFTDPFTRLEFDYNTIILVNNINDISEYLFEFSNFNIIKKMIMDDIPIYKLNGYVIMEFVRHNRLDLIKYIFQNNKEENKNFDFDIIYAIRTNSLDTLIINDIDDINFDEVKKNNYAFFKSCYYSINNNIMKFFIDSGIDINNNDNEAFYSAFKNGNMNSMKFLLENGSKINSNTLLDAIKFSKIEVIKFLIDNGANINDNIILYTFKYCKDINKIKFLLNQGVNINYNNGILFSSVCDFGDLNFIKYLLNRGANKGIFEGFAISIKKLKYDISDYIFNNIFNLENTRKALILYSCKNNNISLFRYLITFNIQLNDEMLLFAIKNNNYEMVKGIINKGKNININNENILFAIKNNNYEMVKGIINKGKNININNENILFAIIESELQNIDIFNLLIDNGMNINNNKALIESVKNNKDEITKYFVLNAIDINFNDSYLLIDAINYNKLWLVRILVENDANIYNRNNLPIKCAMNHYDIFIYLASKIKNLNEIGNELLIIAAGSDNIQVLKYLVMKGFNIDDKALIQACIYNKLVNVIYLIDNGANADNENALYESLLKGHVDIIEYLIDNGADINYNNDELLINAIEDNNLKMVKLLLVFGADINARNSFPLLTAIENQTVKMVRLLVDDKNIDLNNDCLIIAVLKQNVGIVELLLSNDVNVSRNNNEAILLAIKIANPNLEIVELLIENGADIHVNNNELLDFSTINNQIELTKILVENGIKANEQALYNAVYNKNLSMVKFLVEHGANRRNKDILNLAYELHNREIIDYLIG